MRKSLGNIHKHGMDIEMANLRVKSDRINILKVDLTHGLPLNRLERHAISNYDVVKEDLFGAPLTRYHLKGTKPHSLLDNLLTDYRPYTLAVTVAMQSPMKLFVWNQNRSAVIFGNKD